MELTALEELLKEWDDVDPYNVELTNVFTPNKHTLKQLIENWEEK